MPLPLAIATGGMRDTSLKIHNFTWATFKERLRKPQIGGKDGSYYIRGSELRQPRRADDNLLSAKTIILDGDSSVDPETGEITPGAPDLHLVAGALKDLGITFCAHTSHSFVPGKLWKYRIIIPAEIQDQRALDASVSWLISQLHSRGIWLADVTENHRWSQPWYSSRVSDREALKHFLFVEHDADSFPLQKAMDALRLAEKQAEKEEQARRSQVVQQRPEGNIQAFNKAFTLSDARSTLERAGYRFGYYDKANNSYRFMRPGSETKTYGAVLFQGAMGDWCTYSHHGSADPLSSRVCDPFELVAVLQHGGDLKAAARALFPKEKSVVEKLQERAQKQSPPPFEGEPKNILGNSGKNFLLESQMNQGHLPNGDDFGSKHPHAALHSPYFGTTPHDVQKVEQSQGVKKRINLIPWGDLRDEPVRYLVDGLIPARSFGAIYGKPGSYKSFVALYIAAMVATGGEAFGRSCTQGAVVYIAGEGGAGLYRRRLALQKHYNVPADAPVFFVKAALNLGTTLDDRDALVAEIRALNVNPALVIIDTYARMTAGIEENSAKDTSAAIAIMSSIEAETGAAVLIVHHSGKAQEAGLRGSSALLAALDCELLCEKISAEGAADRFGRLSLTKSKDSEDGIEIPYRATVVGLSDIDESLTSLVIEPCAPEEIAAMRKPPKERIGKDAAVALQALQQAIAEGGSVPPIGDRAPRGTKAVSKDLWRGYFTKLTTKEDGAMRTAWSRAPQQLVEARRVDHWGDWYWLTKEPEAFQPPARQSQALETYDDIPFP
jgi:RecA-family ATPase